MSPKSPNYEYYFWYWNEYCNKGFVNVHVNDFNARYLHVLGGNVHDRAVTVLKMIKRVSNLFILFIFSFWASVCRRCVFCVVFFLAQVYYYATVIYPHGISMSWITYCSKETKPLAVKSMILLGRARNERLKQGSREITTNIYILLGRASHSLNPVIKF